MKCFTVPLLLCSVLFLPATTRAQRGGRNEGPSFSWSGQGKGNGLPSVFGLTAGIAFSQVTGHGNGPAVNADHRTGPAVAAYMAVPVNNWLSIRPELGYIATGARNAFTPYNLDAAYLVLPVLASVQLPNMRGTHILIGPQLGMLLSAKEWSAGPKTNIRDRMNMHDIAAVGGAEYVFGHLGFSFRYQHGFTNTSLLAGETMHNRAWILSAGIRL